MITSKYTYTEDVFPILNARCGACHMPGGVAPMSLLTYKDAFPWAESIRLELTAAHMPPAYADPGYGLVKDSHRLSPREFDVLMTWATGGTPEGPSKKFPVIAVRNEWKLGKPDLVVPMSAPYTMDADTMESTREFVLMPGGAVDRWVKAVDLLPGTPAVVRSATVLTRSNDQTNVLGLWLPGEAPSPTPAGTAFRWPAGAELVLRVHYMKTWTYDGKVINDRSTVGLYLSNSVAQEIRTISDIDRDVQALALTLDGGAADKDVKAEALLPNGSRVPLIQLLSRPGWSRRYWFTRPVALPRGSRINIIGDSQSRVSLDVIDRK
jgi:hypothetical protein